MQSRRMDIHQLKVVPLLFMCAIMFSFVNAWAYSPPIGIPDPGMWGTTHPIDSTAPSTATKCPSWPTGQTTNCYYIDNTHAQATDTNNTYGYPSKPRLTIPAITYSAGSYVEIAGGPYTGDVTLIMNGTAESPIWFRGSSYTSMPDLRMKIAFVNAKYLIVENLDFNTGTKAGITLSGSIAANNVCVRNSKFHNLPWPGSNSAVIGATPLQGGSIHDLVFYKNLFYDIGDWLTTVDQDYHAINPDLWGRTPPTTVYNVWVLNNTGYHISGNLVQFNGDQRDVARAIAEVPPRTETNLDYFHHMYVGFNYAHHNKQDLSVTKMTRDAIISQNVSHDNFNGSSGTGVGVVFQEGPDYVWIIFNKFYNMDYGIKQGNMSYEQFANQKTFMIGNVIYNMYQKEGTYSSNNRYKAGQGIGFEKGNHQRWIIDNTIFDVGGGINATTGIATDIVEMSGNVIAGVTGVDYLARADYHVSRLEPIGTVGVDYGFFQPRSDTGKTRFIWAGASTVQTDSVSAFKTASGECANCWEGDPMFVNAANYDLHPQTESPLIGKNTRHPVYDEFQARYKISIAYDFDGKPRPSGAWTIGAFEGGSTTQTTLPAPQYKTIDIE